MSWPPGADHNPDLNRPHYVIIGAGFSALLNHLLLRTNPDRLKGLPILHIADQADPWSRYKPPAPMGQWRNALALPRFRPLKSYPTGPETFLGSDVFDQLNQQEWANLTCRSKYYALHRRVIEVDRGSGGSRFLIRFAGETEGLPADFVDVCGGPGASRRLDPAIVDPGLWGGYESPKAGSIERLLTGEDYLLHAERRCGRQGAGLRRKPDWRMVRRKC
jgi:hypothetical protein